MVAGSNPARGARIPKTEKIFDRKPKCSGLYTMCKRCKKPFQEIDLTWIQLKGNLHLLCKECHKIAAQSALKETSKQSEDLIDNR